MLLAFSSVACIRLIFFIRYLLDISRFKKVLVQFYNLGVEKIILKVDIFDCEALKVRNLLKRELVQVLSGYVTSTKISPVLTSPPGSLTLAVMFADPFRFINCCDTFTSVTDGGVLSREISSFSLSFSFPALSLRVMFNV